MEYSTPQHLLERLNRQYENFKLDHINEDKALDFCLTAWSLSDWVFYAKYPEGTGAQKIEFHKNELFSQCNELTFMQHIASGTKPFKLLWTKSTINVRVRAEVDLGSSFSISYDSPCMNLEFEDGKVVALNLIIDKVYKFWNSYL